MANATETFTIDTASSPWVLQNGKATTVLSTTQTFTMYIIDLGDTGIRQGGGGDAEITLADGTKIKICQDKRLVQLGTFTDGTAKTNPGSLWVSENDGPEVEVKVTTATFADADAVATNAITTITFEYPGKPWKWTWTNINSA